MVQEEGLEPTRLSALDPKSSASANSATLAHFKRALSPNKPGRAIRSFTESPLKL
jgi:hypothetical protein